MRITLLAIALMISALFFCSIAASVYAGPEDQVSSIEPVEILSSSITTGDDTVCLDGMEMTEKSLTLKVRSESGDESLVESRRWWEATGKNCGASDPKIKIELPAANEQLKTMIAQDRKGMHNLAAGQLRADPFCSNECSYMQGRYECWSGHRYWIDYCFNECNKYTGQYHYNDIGICN